jgi:response regulator of citrate/malate metabolism
MQRFNCVLLVDDDGTTNFINHRLLKRLNVTDNIQSAINGDRAMQFITQFAFQNNNQCPELILLDINMPGADGFDFINVFRTMVFSNRERVRLIILTTSTHSRDLDIIHQENIGYINKPLTEQNLQKALSAFRPIQ